MNPEAAVKAKWLEKIWTHQTIKNITKKILEFEHTEQSQTEVSQLLELDIGGFGQPNYFEFIVSANEDLIEVGQTDRPIYQVIVEVRYTRAKDVDGTAYQATKDAITALRDLVRSQLGSNWDETVDYINPNVSPEKISEGFVNATQCWRQVVRFLAYKQ